MEMFISYKVTWDYDGNEFLEFIGVYDNLKLCCSSFDKNAIYLKHKREKNEKEDIRSKVHLYNFRNSTRCKYAIEQIMLNHHY